MTDPNVIAAGSAGLVAAVISQIPGIDANAVIGAFCGALLFSVSAKGLSLWVRLVYLLISFVIGYLGGPAILGSYLEHSAASAFVGATITVTAGLRAIESVRTLDLRAWLGGKK